MHSFLTETENGKFELNARSWAKAGFPHLQSQIKALKKQEITPVLDMTTIKRNYLSECSQLTPKEKSELEACSFTEDENIIAIAHSFANFEGLNDYNVRIVKYLRRSFNDKVKHEKRYESPNYSSDFKTWLEEEVDGDVIQLLQDSEDLKNEHLSLIKKEFQEYIAEEIQKPALFIFACSNEKEIENLDPTAFKTQCCFLWCQEDDALYYIDEKNGKKKLEGIQGCDIDLQKKIKQQKTAILSKELIQLATFLPPNTLNPDLLLVESLNSSLIAQKELMEKKLSMKETIYLNRNHGKNYKQYYENIKKYHPEFPKEEQAFVQITELDISDIPSDHKAQKQIFKALIKANAYGLSTSHLKFHPSCLIPLDLEVILRFNGIEGNKNDVFSSHLKNNTDILVLNENWVTFCDENALLACSLLFQCPAAVKATQLELSLPLSQELFKTLATQPKRFSTLILTNLPPFPWNKDIQHAFKLFLRNTNIEHLHLVFEYDHLDSKTFRQGCDWLYQQVAEISSSSLSEIQLNFQNEETLPNRGVRQTARTKTNHKFVDLFALRRKEVRRDISPIEITHHVQQEEELQLSQELTQEMVQQAMGYDLFQKTVAKTLPYAQNTIVLARQALREYYSTAGHYWKPQSNILGLIWDDYLGKKVHIKEVATHIMVLDQALGQLPTWHECLNLEISEEAARELLPGGSYASMGQSGLNLDYLPKGFFIEETLNAARILRFNQSEYKHQNTRPLTPLHFPQAVRCKDHNLHIVDGYSSQLQILLGNCYLPLSKKGKLAYATAERMEEAFQKYHSWNPEEQALFKSWLSFHDQTLLIAYPDLVMAFEYFLSELERRSLIPPSSFDFKGSDALKEHKINALVLFQNVLSVLDKIPLEHERIMQDFSDYDWSCFGVAAVLQQSTYKDMQYIRPEMALDFMHGWPTCFDLNSIDKIFYRRSEVFPEPSMFSEQIYRALGKNDPATFDTKKNTLEIILDLKSRGYFFDIHYANESQEEFQERCQRSREGMGGIQLTSSMKETSKAHDEGKPNAYFLKYTSIALSLISYENTTITPHERACIHGALTALSDITTMASWAQLSNQKHLKNEEIKQFLAIYHATQKDVITYHLSHAEAMYCLQKAYERLKLQRKKKDHEAYLNTLTNQNRQHDPSFKSIENDLEEIKKLEQSEDENHPLHVLQWLKTHGILEPDIRLYVISKNPRKTDSYFLLTHEVMTQIDKTEWVKDADALQYFLKAVGICQWFLPKESQKITLDALFQDFSAKKPENAALYFQQVFDYLKTHSEWDHFNNFLLNTIAMDDSASVTEFNSDHHYSYYYESNKQLRKNFLNDFQYDSAVDLKKPSLAPVFNPKAELIKASEEIIEETEHSFSESISSYELEVAPKSDINIYTKTSLKFHNPPFDMAKMERLIDGLNAQTFSLDPNELRYRKEKLSYEMLSLQHRRADLIERYESLSLEEIASYLKEARSAYHYHSSPTSKQTIKLAVLELMCQVYRTVSPNELYPNQAQLLAVLDHIEAKERNENPLQTLRAGEGKTLISALTVGMSWFLDDSGTTGFDLLTTRKDTAKKQYDELKPFFEVLGLYPVDGSLMSIDEYLTENVVCIGHDEAVASFLQSHRQSLKKSKKHTGFFDEGDQRLDKKMDIHQAIAHPYLTDDFYHALNNCIDLEDFPHRGSFLEKETFVIEKIQLDLKAFFLTSAELQHYIKAAESAKVLRNRGEKDLFIVSRDPESGTLAVKPLNEATGVPMDLQFGDLHPFLLARYLENEQSQLLDPPGILVQSHTYTTFLKKHYENWSIFTGTPGDQQEIAQLNREGAMLHYYLPFNEDQLDVEHRVVPNALKKAEACEEEIRAMRHAAKHYGIQAPPHWIIVDNIESAEALKTYFLASGLFTEDQLKVATGQEEEKAVLDWCKAEPKRLVITSIFGRATDYRHEPKSLKEDRVISYAQHQFSQFKRFLLALARLFKPKYQAFVDNPKNVLGLHVLVVPGEKVNDERWVEQAIRRTGRFGTPGRALIVTSPIDYENAKNRQHRLNKTSESDALKTKVRDVIIEELLMIGDTLIRQISDDMVDAQDKKIYQLMEKVFQDTLKNALRTMKDEFLSAEEKGKFRSQKNIQKWKDEWLKAFWENLTINVEQELDNAGENSGESVALVSNFIETYNAPFTSIPLKQDDLHRKDVLTNSLPFTWIQTYLINVDLDFYENSKNIFPSLKNAILAMYQMLNAPLPKEEIENFPELYNAFQAALRAYAATEFSQPSLLRYFVEFASWIDQLDATQKENFKASFSSLLLSTLVEKAEHFPGNLEASVSWIEESLDGFQDQFSHHNEWILLEQCFLRKGLSVLEAKIIHYGKKRDISKDRKHFASQLNNIITNRGESSTLLENLLQLQNDYFGSHQRLKQDYTNSRYYRLLEESIQLVQIEAYRENQETCWELLKKDLLEQLPEDNIPVLSVNLEHLKNLLNTKDSEESLKMSLRLSHLVTSLKTTYKKEKINNLQWEQFFRKMNNLLAVLEEKSPKKTVSNDEQSFFFNDESHRYKEELLDLTTRLTLKGFTDPHTPLGNLANEVRTIIEKKSPLVAYKTAIKQIHHATSVPEDLLKSLLVTPEKTLTDYCYACYHVSLLLESLNHHLQEGQTEAAFISFYLLSKACKEYQADSSVLCSLLKSQLRLFKNENKPVFLRFCKHILEFPPLEESDKQYFMTPLELLSSKEKQQLESREDTIEGWDVFLPMLEKECPFNVLELEETDLIQYQQYLKSKLKKDLAPAHSDCLEAMLRQLCTVEHLYHEGKQAPFKKANKRADGS